MVNNYKYDEWENIEVSNETVPNPFKYSGEVYDQETGLYYLRARYYDPVVGRFVNEDSYEGQIDKPLTLNLYTYCLDNPILYFDPSGNSSMKISDELVTMIADYETFSSVPYYATEYEKEKGIQTIGYGHVIMKGEIFTSITQQEALDLLIKDLQWSEDSVNELLGTTEVNQNEFDALVSFEYNTGGLANSELLKDVINGNNFKDQWDFMQWTRQGSDHLSGLWVRRMDEWQIFEFGDYIRNVNPKDAPWKWWRIDWNDWSSVSHVKNYYLK